VTCSIRLKPWASRFIWRGNPHQSTKASSMLGLLV
jgi:hypothetical protein